MPWLRTRRARSHSACRSRIRQNPKEVTVPVTVNGLAQTLPDDPRVSLLDFLRESLGLYGTKKGCDQGACGACTVLAHGVRILSCLALAAQCEGCGVTTVEGLADAGAPHPLQEAFIEHD